MSSRAIDKEFEDADDTGVLDISGRNLRQFPNVPGELLDFNYVFEIDLSNNRFDKVPRVINQFKALVKLNCHHNSIRWLPEELYMLVNLKEIDISRNFLQKVPNELCDLNLYSINLSNNRLISIPSKIGILENIQFLDVSCNMLEELPDSLFTLTKLRHLNLHRNNLTDLSDDIYQLSQLHYLDVSSNSISRLPITLRLMVPNLQHFTAEDNPLEYPPPHLCSRGLVHICKYLDKLEKKGSNPLLLASTQRDDSLRRRKDRIQKKISMHRPLSESTPNGKDKEMGLLDEMANLVNKTFGDKDGEKTPTGSLHWSIAQYMTSEKQTNLSNQSKEEYREATLRLYMQQEGGHKVVARPSSPGSSSLNETTSTMSPQRKSDENVYRSSTMTSGDLSRPAVMGRCLSNEKFPRSGSWNSHMRKTSPVLPSKYIAPDRSSEEKNRQEQKTSSSSSGAPPVLLSSQSAAELTSGGGGGGSSSSSSSGGGGGGGGSGGGGGGTSPSKQPMVPPATATTSTAKKRPPPLVTTKPLNGERGEDSDHEGSLTPTNETPPSLDALDEPSTPKDDDDEIFSDMLKDENVNSNEGETESVSSTNKSVSFSSSVEDIPPSIRVQEKSSKPLPTPPPKPSKRYSQGSSDIEITELESSPTSTRRLPSVSEPESDLPTDKSTLTSPNNDKWSRLASPRRKKEKDVFKFLKESEPNYTIRRQQMQMSLLLEKNQLVKKTVESLVGVKLSDDIGEWVMDGVVLCRVINTLHPGTISIIHTPPDGQTLSRIKQTINISAFIDACKTLKVPEEELCSAGDIVELKDPVRVITCLQRVLETKPGNLI